MAKNMAASPSQVRKVLSQAEKLKLYSDRREICFFFTPLRATLADVSHFAFFPKISLPHVCMGNYHFFLRQTTQLPDMRIAILK